MEAKLFKLGTNVTIEEIVNRINEIIGNKFSVLEAKDEIEKWTGVPNFLLLDESVQQKIIEYAQYIDELLISVEEKALYLISLSGVIQFTNILASDYDTGSLFLLADFYKEHTIAEIRDSFSVISNPKLLLAIRNKTLDIKMRKKLLLEFINQVNYDKIDKSDQDAINSYIDQYILQL